MRKMDQRKHEEHIRHTFNGFCINALRWKAIDIQREICNRNKREVSFSDLSARELFSIAVTDKYFADEYIFTVLGYDVSVDNDYIAEALSALPADRREIVMMSCYCGMSDREIAEHLNMARRTVADHREKTLAKLGKILVREDWT